MLVESANHEYLRYCPGKIGGGTTHVPTPPPPKFCTNLDIPLQSLLLR